MKAIAAPILTTPTKKVVCKTTKAIRKKEIAVADETLTKSRKSTRLANRATGA